jgi:deoxyribodipyrimidine photolyase
VDFNTLLTAVITNGIGAACAAAVLWFSWHRETKTLPEMVRSFTATIKELAEKLEKKNTEMLTAFETRNDKLLELAVDLSREERTIYQRSHDENRARLEGIVADLKEQRHFINNLAHQAGLKKATEEAQARAQHAG